MIQLYYFIKKMYLSIKSKYKLYVFRRNSIFGKNFQCHSNAACTNFSGDTNHIRIGDNTSIDAILSVDESGQIFVGDFTIIRQYSRIYSSAKIFIGNYCIISTNVWICDNNNHPTDPNQRIAMCKSGFEGELWAWKYSDKADITIEDNVWIGEHCTILKGVTIGRGSVVATRSVVTKDVPPYSIVAGNPAVVVKQLRNQNDLGKL